MNKGTIILEPGFITPEILMEKILEAAEMESDELNDARVYDGAYIDKHIILEVL